MLSKAPTVTLSNGLVVANFSSPHNFVFEEGSILLACEKDRVEALSLEKIESTRFNITPNGSAVAVEIYFEITQVVLDELEALDKDPTINIILVPFPVLEAYKSSIGGVPPAKVYVVYMVDRVNKIASSRKFCI